MKRNNRNLQLIFTALVTILLFVASCSGPAGPDGDDAVIADSLSPEIEWVFPESGSVVDSSVTLASTATDDQGISKVIFYISGFEFDGELADTTMNLYQFNWRSALWPEGPYTLMARVWDNARNHANTRTVIVNVVH